MKKLLFVAFVVIIISSLNPYPPAIESRLDTFIEIEENARGCVELIKAYVDGFVVNGGMQIILTQEQKDSIKADYNHNIIFLRDSVDYDALLAP